eukprot:TRINITY_DN5540_c0_g2_i1.p2 TRINITY_DN5540_c0_g2~~TRINITY_DN5540_c0_g2_i1.p2  ORF type:complete len:170 (+),score=3.85 TRINITY_DN5540_c0_g2_i1:1777-2286(+)
MHRQNYNQLIRTLDTQLTGQLQFADDRSMIIREEIPCNIPRTLYTKNIGSNMKQMIKYSQHLKTYDQSTDVLQNFKEDVNINEANKFLKVLYRQDRPTSQTLLKLLSSYYQSYNNDKLDRLKQVNNICQPSGYGVLVIVPQDIKYYHYQKNQKDSKAIRGSCFNVLPKP